MIFNQQAINVLAKYFKWVNIEELLSEKDNKLLRYKVISHWEFGVSQFMIAQGLRVGNYIDYKELTDYYNIRNDANISHKLYEELLSHGYPLIKKKVLFEQKNKSGKNEQNWKMLIMKYGNSSWDLEAIIEEIDDLNNEVRRIKRPGLINKIILHLQRKLIKSDVNFIK